MTPATACILLSVLAGGIAANGPLILGHISCWMGNEGSYVSPKRRSPADSDLIIAGHLSLLGACVGAVVVWLGGTDDTFIVFVAAFVSFFAASRYAFCYARKLNRFYLSRAQRLLVDGDLFGASEDAREVARSSPTLRAQARSILRAADQVRKFQPVRDPVEALVAVSTVGIDKSQLA